LFFMLLKKFTLFEIQLFTPLQHPERHHSIKKYAGIKMLLCPLT
jgi:hypothetical protein